MKTHFFTPSTNRLLGVLGFVGLLALTLWSMWGMPKPREEDRVESVTRSFSIIHPPAWEVTRGIGDTRSAYLATIACSPLKSVGRATWFFAGEYKQPQNPQALGASGYMPIVIDGRAAWGRGVRSAHDYSYAALFERDQRWFEVSVRLPREDDVPGSDWWPYFQTLRPGRAAATLAATMP